MQYSIIIIVCCQVSEAGIHRPHVSGIHGRDGEGAYSIVLAGGYEDDLVSSVTQITGPINTFEVAMHSACHMAAELPQLLAILREMETMQLHCLVFYNLDKTAICTRGGTRARSWIEWPETPSLIHPVKKLFQIEI